MPSAQPEVEFTPLPLWKSLLAGAMAGMSETLTMYPTDVMKTRAQLSTTPMTMSQTFLTVLKKDGPLGFYRGLLSPLIGEASKRSVKFCTNDYYKLLFADKNGNVSNWGAFGGGWLAGTTEACIICPFEVVKVRMQSPDYKHLYSSTIDCVVKVAKENGISGLYQGLEAQMWRNATWNAAYFGTISACHCYFPLSPEASKKQQLLYNLCAGFLGGMFGVFCNIAPDCAKSRIQNSKPGVGPYRWCIPTLIYMTRHEGFKACFKGLGFKMMRLAPGGGIMSLVHSQAVELLRPL